MNDYNGPERRSVPAHDWDQLVHDVQQIKNAIIGDAQMGSDGLVVKVREVDKRVKTLERLAFVVSGGAFVASIFYAVLRDSLSIFKKT
jgi:hypothetical protein